MRGSLTSASVALAAYFDTLAPSHAIFTFSFINPMLRGPLPFTNSDKRLLFCNAAYFAFSPLDAIRTHPVGKLLSLCLVEGLRRFPLVAHHTLHRQAGFLIVRNTYLANP